MDDIDTSAFELGIGLGWIEMDDTSAFELGIGLVIHQSNWFPLPFQERYLMDL